jgi:hypothetical protein
VVVWANNGDPGGGSIDTQFGTQSCNGRPITILYEVSVKDDHDGMTALDVELHWRGKLFAGSKRMGIRGPVFYADLGPFNFKDTKGQSDSFLIWITATDSGQKTTTLRGKGVTLLSCSPIT